MMQRAISIPVGAGLMIAALLMASPAPADPQKEPPNAKKDKPEKGEPAVDDEYRREAEKLVGGIEVEIKDDDKWSKVKRIEKPLLFYGDPTRDNDRGVCGDGARRAGPSSSSNCGSA